MHQVNELTGGDYLSFTTEIWNPTTEVKLTAEEEGEWKSISKETRKRVKEHIDKWFPFLDMRMKWENEKFHLTSYSDSTASRSIDKLYPDHAKALNTANLVNGKSPKFGVIWKHQADDVAMEEKKKKQKDNRNV
eukprot:14000233-Ditylum_brightwellii.AAC.1